MLNIDNGCVTSLKGDKSTKKKVFENAVTVYDVKWDNKSKSIVRNKIELGKDKWTQYPYIDFINVQKEYMDSSIGTFEIFLRNNPNIFVDVTISKTICDIVSCFRTECRNGYFHTQNLYDSEIVDKTRENAILLYAVLLGSVKKNVEKKLN